MSKHVLVIEDNEHLGEEKETALKPGLAEYLEKPIKAEQLRETIEHFLYRGG